MAINKETEKLIRIKDVPAYLEPKIGKRLSLPVIYRWTEKGIHGVRLELTYLFNQSFTSAEALERFDQRTTEAKLAKMNAPKPAKPASSKQVQRSHERAKARLAG